MKDALGTLVVFGSFAVIGWCFWLFGRHLHSGSGWGKRATHSCGWFDSSDYQSIMLDTRLCPGCGACDAQWKDRIGRVGFPWGWEWKD